MTPAPSTPACKECGVVDGVLRPAAFVVPGAPPQYRPIPLCAEHAEPYTTKRSIR